MNSLLKISFGFFTALAISLNSAAAAETDSTMPKKTSESSARKPSDGTKHRYFAIPKDIQLTTEQTTKLDEIKQKLAPKIVELTNKQRALLTKEQKAARHDAIAKAKLDGLKGKVRTAAIDEATNLTDDQKKQDAEIKAEFAKLRTEIKQQISSLLTEEQRTQMSTPKSKKTAAT